MVQFAVLFDFSVAVVVIGTVFVDLLTVTPFVVADLIAVTSFV